MTEYINFIILTNKHKKKKEKNYLVTLKNQSIENDKSMNYVLKKRSNLKINPCKWNLLWKFKTNIYKIWYMHVTSDKNCISHVDKRLKKKSITLKPLYIQKRKNGMLRICSWTTAELYFTSSILRDWKLTLLKQWIYSFFFINFF